MKFLIVAGGTGGHIFPALALIEKIKENPNNKYLYVGTTDRMENEIVPSMGIPYKSLKIHGLSKNLIKNFHNIKDVLKAIKGAEKIIKEFEPDFVVCFGGYVTFPIIIAANKKKIPIFLHEQNVIPGKVNKFLGFYAKKIFISFKESEKYFNVKKTIYSGNPCMEKAKNIKKNDKTELGFDKNKKLILIVMGSEGSSVVNEKLLDFLRNFNENDKEILFITGKKQFATLNNNLIVPHNVKIVPFYMGLPALMKDADLIISRAGASTISEIIATNIPSILIPSPYVANNHQYYNALALKELGVSKMIEQDHLSKETLEGEIKAILDNSKELDRIKNILKNMDKPNPSTIIYNEIIKR